MTTVDKIKKLLKSGKTVYFSTYIKTTKLTKKHINMIKTGKNNTILIQHGKRWLDYTYTKITYI